jgi:1,4-dihydroxy-6-naphthoate synthase
VKIIDFGEQWENVMHHPIPLGTIIARRDIGIDTAKKVSRIIRRSIEYAYAHTDEAMPYIRNYARELSDNVIKSHIGLYVNDFSIDLGTEGKDAITFLYQKALEVGMITQMPENMFLG